MWGPELHCIFEMCTNKIFVEWEDHVFVFVPEIAGNEPQYSAGRFAAHLWLFLPLEVFGDEIKYKFSEKKENTMGKYFLARSYKNTAVYMLKFCTLPCKITA